jgi:hypothetical protein
MRTRAVDWHRHFLNYFNLEHPFSYRRDVQQSSKDASVRAPKALSLFFHLEALNGVEGQAHRKDRWGLSIELWSLPYRVP